jgi:hypothetical protein
LPTALALASEWSDRGQPPTDNLSRKELSVNEINTFRLFDLLFSINQACTETAAQLRMSHLYQLKKDRHSLLEKLFLTAIAAVTIIPTLDHLFPGTDLKWYWIIAAVIFGMVLCIAERDRFIRDKTLKSYEDIRSFDSLVTKDKTLLLSDYISSYTTRHDILYSLYQGADESVKPWLRKILDYYHGIFQEKSQQLTELMSQKPPGLDQKTYNDLMEYIKVCEDRYRKLSS